MRVSTHCHIPYPSETPAQIRWNSEHMSSEGISDILTNEAIPRTEATITIRVIKSFEYRTERSLVLHKLNLETTTVGDLKEIVRQGTCDYLLDTASDLTSNSAIQTGPAWRPYRNAVLGSYTLPGDVISWLFNVKLDTLKLYVKAHGAKVRKLLGLGKSLPHL